MTDPCSIELGVGWSIPTKAEWINVDASGGLTDWNGLWNSGLKLHAAGLLNLSDGSLIGRGSYGYNWSIAESYSDCGLALAFSSGCS